MAMFGLAILLGGRSDMVRGLRGDGRDEYWQRIDVHATALAGNVVILAILAMCVWEWSHGRDGSPFVQLGAIAGVAYLVVPRVPALAGMSGARRRLPPATGRLPGVRT